MGCSPRLRCAHSRSPSPSSSLRLALWNHVPRELGLRPKPRGGFATRMYLGRRPPDPRWEPAPDPVRAPPQTPFWRGSGDGILSGALGAEPQLWSGAGTPAIFLLRNRPGLWGGAPIGAAPLPPPSGNATDCRSTIDPRHPFYSSYTGGARSKVKGPPQIYGRHWRSQRGGGARRAAAVGLGPKPRFAAKMLLCTQTSS